MLYSYALDEFESVAEPDAPTYHQAQLLNQVHSRHSFTRVVYNQVAVTSRGSTFQKSNMHLLKAEYTVSRD